MRLTALVLSAVLIGPLLAFAGHSLATNEEAVIDKWLGNHKQYRLAMDSDCDCTADIRTLREQGYGGRWKPVPNYHPYVATGDFNGDGVEDFAVVVVNRSRKEKKFTLLVFNGPLDSLDTTPAFVEPNVDLRQIGLFYGPPRPKPYRLVVGPYESEGYVLVPKGKTYRLKDISPIGE